ncbi:uncharacterized protein [Anabrus simplex]|uniref:uncharacterized protein n=1 Tax=Anabrus simplex TaxID=316456 RepID=UPI0035A389CB
MVHKKSEYRLQFHLLPKELRKQIWQDNVKFREGRRSVNQADHYWSYQLTDEKCDCDNDDDEDDGAVLPPHKLKHKALLARYESEKSARKGPQAVSRASSPVCKPRNEERQEQPSSSVSRPKNSEMQQQQQQRQVVLRDTECDLPSARERAVQTPDWSAEEYRKSDNSARELQNRMQSLKLSPAPSRREYHPFPSSRWSERPLPATAEGPRSRPTSALSYRHDPRSIGRRPHSRCSEDSSRHISPSRFSSLSRTSRKSFYEEKKKTPFAYYGWNEGDTDIGGKKTYNISAPRKEVHPHALLALQQRKEDIKKFLAHEADKLREAQSSRTSMNSSAIWMSEYQQNYNSSSQKHEHTEKIVRPASASILKKPVCWRYS